LLESCRIKAEPSNFESLGKVDFGVILGLKTNKANSIEFTAESHILKLRILMSSFNKLVQKQVMAKNKPQIEKMMAIGLFNQLAQQVGIKEKENNETLKQ
jgi:hypothetical protein